VSVVKHRPLVAYVLPIWLSSPSGGVSREGSKGRVHREWQVVAMAVQAGGPVVLVGSPWWRTPVPK
jgi:hypothetical protein